jgi:hypothetical protein
MEAAAARTTPAAVKRRTQLFYARWTSIDATVLKL